MVLWILSQNDPEALVFPLGVLEARVPGTSGAVKESPSKPVITLHACEPSTQQVEAEIGHPRLHSGVKASLDSVTFCLRIRE